MADDMFGMFGLGDDEEQTTDTTVHQAPPQLMNEARPGYEAARDYYLDMLANPPVYDGPRTAPRNPAEDAYLDQSRDYFGVRQPYQDESTQQIRDTMGGKYLNDPTAEYADYTDYFPDRGSLASTDRLNTPFKLENPFLDEAPPTAVGALASYTPYKHYTPMTEEEYQKVVTSMMDPYLRKLEESTLPQINADFGVTQGGINSTREQVSEEQAIRDNSQLIADQVIGPLMAQMEQLEEDYIKSENDRLAAIANGDADRATNASIASAQIKSNFAELKNQLEISQAQINSQRDISASELETGANIEDARNILSQTEGDKTRGLEAWNSERGRMTDMAIRGPAAIIDAEAMRLAQLMQSGEYERMLNELEINAARERFEEPITRRSGSANALFGATGVGPGSATSSTTQVIPGDALGDASSLVGMAAAVMSMVGMSGGCWIAEAIYGKNSLETLFARFWINVGWKGPVADITRFLYLRFGKKAAHYVERSSLLKAVLRPLFNVAVRKGLNHARWIATVAGPRLS